ncbi:MAG TPA: T9SS type A sorting domain-containing protein [Ferruginibacter sp.]|nr:T9SS type A sorting domain-containing protein [Ferruginibacter sp.]
MKKFLPAKKSLIACILLTGLLLFTLVAGFAATKTWAGGTGPGKNWTTGGNWSGGTAPVAGDDIIFNTAGTITFSTMPAASISYNSLTIDLGSVVTVVGGSAITLTIGGNPDVDFVISGGGSSFTLGANINLTLAANSSANISGDFFILTGRTYNTDASLAVTSVFGTINNQGTITSTSAGKLLFQSGCAYIHNQNGGNLPTATWDINSFCNITGLTTTHPTGGNQAFGNLTYNCTGMTANVTMTNGVSVTNAFTVLNTGSARLLMTAGSFTVGGDLQIESNFTISGTTDRTLTVTGNAFISGGGNLDLCSGNVGNVGTLNVGGNFTSFGAITETGNGRGQINFNGTAAAQTFNQSGAFVNVIGIGIDNTNGVTFSGASITLDHALTLTNGVLTIPAGNTLTIANGNVIGGTGFGTGKHINTQVSGATQAFVRIDNMAAGIPYVIPTGNGTSYLPATLTPADASSFTVGVFTGITENGAPNGVAFTALKKQGCVDAVWTINRNSGTLGTDMTLAWPAALEGSSFTTFNTNQIGIAHWDNPSWGNCVGTGNNTANTATRPGVTLFSPFSVGKTPYILPVKFSYVNAAKTNGSNTVYWKAACSSSEVIFGVERSTDGTNFSTINSIHASQARCAQPFDYIDNSGLSGNIFYRIRSVEATGVITYSTIVKISDQQQDMKLKAVLPNPVMQQAQLSIASPRKEVVNLVLVSMEGKMVQQTTVQLQAGTSIVSLDVANLQAGVYMIKGTFGNGKSNTVKFIKQ